MSPQSTRLQSTSKQRTSLGDVGWNWLCRGARGRRAVNFGQLLVTGDFATATEPLSIIRCSTSPTLVGLRDRAWFRVLAAAFGLYARFVFAEVEPPVGRRSRPLGGLLDVVHEIRLGASFEERSRSFVFQRRQRDVGPLLNQMLTELVQDSAHLIGLEANRTQWIGERRLDFVRYGSDARTGFSKYLPRENRTV